MCNYLLLFLTNKAFTTVSNKLILHFKINDSLMIIIDLTYSQGVKFEIKGIG